MREGKLRIDQIVTNTNPTAILDRYVATHIKKITHFEKIQSVLTHF